MQKAVYRVQWQSNTDSTWDFVNAEEYETREEAMRRLFQEVTNDPQFSHRIVKQVWEVDTIIERSPEE